MRLSRVIPSATEDVESRIFVCDRCRTETIQVVRSSTSRLPEMTDRRFPPPWRADKIQPGVATRGETSTSERMRGRRD